tara:strand:+ start:52505 stop:53428 length:924 start_codon:yes stop_codon:yes gene_type:complete
MKLAIVIPFYKLLFFDETLNSLSSQTNKNFKVYIGNDASYENPIELLEKHQGQFDFVYHRFETNLGGISLTKHWSRCIDLIQEEQWIMILGDDDYISDTFVESFYRHHSVFNEKSSLVRFASSVFDMDSNAVFSRVFKHPIWENAYDACCRKVRGETRSSLSEYVFSKAIYSKKQFTNYPLAFFSDDKAWLDFSDGKPIYSINDSIVYVRVSQISISGRTDNLSLKIEAEINFFSELYFNKLYAFNEACRLVIIRKFESALLKKEKLRMFQWIHLYYSYLRNYDKKTFFKFNKRLIKTVLYREKVFY